jgi:iron(III) transport system substrate-binding protein
VFPNQNDIGAHMNISGGGVAVNAPNRENAIAVPRIPRLGPGAGILLGRERRIPRRAGRGPFAVGAALGIFRPDVIDLSDIVDNIDAAVEVLNAAGWE